VLDSADTYLLAILGAAEAGNVTALAAILGSCQAQDDKDRPAGLGQALSKAAECGHAKCCGLLLAAGADPCFAGCSGQPTPLMLACRYGHADAVRLLLEAGSARSIDSTDHDGLAAVDHACHAGSAECLGMLLDAGASPSRPHLGPATRGRTRLMAACASGGSDVLELLWSRGEAEGSLHDVDERGRTALHIAVGEGRVEAVRWLLAKGAQVDVRADDGSRALALAIHGDVPLDVTKALLAAGAAAGGATTQDGSSILCFALACFASVDTVRELARYSLSMVELHAAAQEADLFGRPEIADVLKASARYVRRRRLLHWYIAAALDE